MTQITYNISLACINSTMLRRAVKPFFPSPRPFSLMILRNSLSSQNQLFNVFKMLIKSPHSHECLEVGWGKHLRMLSLVEILQCTGYKAVALLLGHLRVLLLIGFNLHPPSATPLSLNSYPNSTEGMQARSFQPDHTMLWWRLPARLLKSVGGIYAGYLGWDPHIRYSQIHFLGNGDISITVQNFDNQAVHGLLDTTRRGRRATRQHTSNGSGARRAEQMGIYLKPLLPLEEAGSLPARLGVSTMAFWLKIWVGLSHKY